MVSLHTHAYLDEDNQLMVQVKANEEYHGKQVNLPARALMYFYPLYSHYTWRYSRAKDDLVLNVSKQAPENTKNWVDKYTGGVTLTNLLGKPAFETPFKIEHVGINQVYLDNITLMQEFKSMQFTTWLDLDTLTQADYENNNRLISTYLQDIKGNCYQRYQEDVHHKPLLRLTDGEGNVMHLTENEEHLLYTYATDYELQLLIIVGCAYQMNRIIKKIIKAKDK